MKRTAFILLIILFIPMDIFSQNTNTDTNRQEAIQTLIEKYTRSRETSDTTALKSILTSDIDQLVSSGEWRIGIQAATKGMLRSSAGNPGERTINVDKIRFLNEESAIVDSRYEIRNADGTTRRMWSSFIVVYENNTWKITAIRNMLPAG